jgi:hypothetical protein
VALRQTMSILRSLFAFLASQGYLVGNPFAAVSAPPVPQRPLGSHRALTFAQWDHVDVLLQDHVDLLEILAFHTRDLGQAQPGRIEPAHGSAKTSPDLGILRRAKPALSQSQYHLLEGVLGTFVYVMLKLQNAKTSIKRFQRMLFGARTARRRWGPPCTACSGCAAGCAMRSSPPRCPQAWPRYPSMTPAAPA